jgi:hypothetical protein
MTASYVNGCRGGFFSYISRMKNYSINVLGNGNAFDWNANAETLPIGSKIKHNGEFFLVVDSWIDSGPNATTGGATVVKIPTTN